MTDTSSNNATNQVEQGVAPPCPIADVKSLINEAKKEVLVNKAPLKALGILNGINEQRLLSEEEKLSLGNTLGFIHLENRDYSKAAEIFSQLDEKYKAGYCELLQGNEESAEKLWESAPDCEPVRWGKCLLGFIKLKTGITPTFLQVRNHLEVDIGYFIEANKPKYVEHIIKYDYVFITVNLEAYKLIGRVMMNYGYFNLARKYLVKSLDIIPDDAETFYFLGQYNYLIGAYKESERTLEQCLERNSGYVPARMLLEKVGAKLGK
jgi:tetratricopeptide (TPR) repeat protein